MLLGLALEHASGRSAAQLYDTYVFGPAGMTATALPTAADVGLSGLWSGDAEDGGPGTDFHAVMQGYVSITPLQLDRTFHEAFAGLDVWLEGLL